MSIRVELVDARSRRRARRAAYHRRVVDGAHGRSFIGREAELDRLARAYARAIAGESRVVVVAGEAGIGKTRLVGTFVERIDTPGVRVLTGGCLPLGTGGLPYGPFVEAFRELFRDVDPAALPALLGPGRDELARLMPEVRARPDRHDRGPATATATADAPLDERFAQVRLFELVLGVIERLARLAPVVLVVEDLHWADRSTRDLLAFLARNLRDAPVLVLATLRTDEGDPQRTFVTFAAELQRGERVERIDVGRLDRTELARLLADETGREPDATLVDRTLERTDGNPFYAEQIIAASRETDGDAVPARLRDVVLARVAAVSDPAQEVLRVASAAGVRIDDELLVTVCDLPGTVVRAALREVVDRGILVPAGGPGDPHVAFRHALLREVIHDELLPGERARLHGRYAEALEGRAAARTGGATSSLLTPTAAELAYHWDAAGEDGRALPVMVDAARVAEAGYAYLDAHRRYLRAIQLRESLRVVDAAIAIDPTELLVRAAETAVLAGEYRAAVDLGNRAIASVDAIADPERAAGLHERQRWYLWAAGDRAAAAAALEEARRLVPEEPPTAARSRILAHLAGLYMSTGRFTESIPVAQEAVAVARTVGSMADEALALGVLGTDLALIGRVDEGIGRFREGVAIAEALGSVEGVALGATNLATLLDRVGRTDEALRVATDGWERARAIGVERTYGGLLLAVAAKAAIALGRWDEADTFLALGLANDPIGTSGIRLRVQRGRLETLRGELARGADLVAEARAADDAAGGTDDRASILAAYAESAIAMGRTAEARAAIDAALLMSAGGPPDPALASLAASALRLEADLAGSARGRRDDGALEEATDRAASIGAEVERIAAALGVPRPGVEATAAYAPSRHLAVTAMCRAEAHRLEATDATSEWIGVASTFEAIGRPYPAAYARYRAATATLRDRGGRDDARVLLSAALATATRLGARPLVEEVETLGRQARLDLAVGDDDATADPTPDAAAHLGLTDREAEILALMAGGWSNQEIADALFISRKTVSVHASHIFDKLGAGNRSEAAAIAHRLGLAAGAPPRPGRAEGGAA